MKAIVLNLAIKGNRIRPSITAVTTSFPTEERSGKLPVHTMLESQPSQSPGVTIGYAFIAGLILIDAGLLLLLISGPVTIFSFVWGLLLLASFPVIAVIGYWTAGLTRARYHVLGNALLIEWGDIRQVVPLQGIQSLMLGREVTLVKRFRGLRWPGLFLGRGWIKENEGTTTHNTYFYATRPLPEQLFLFTETAVYGISPVDLQNFTDCLEALRTADLANDEAQPKSRLGFLTWSIWRDRIAQTLLITAVLLNALLFAYLTAIYNQLPVQIPLHFDPLGQVDRLGSPQNLFILPLIGLLAWFGNGVLGWIFYQGQNQRPPAYLAWIAAVAVQLAVWGAVLGLFAQAGLLKP